MLVLTTILALGVTAIMSPAASNIEKTQATIEVALKNIAPERNPIGTVKVEKITIDDKSHKVNVTCSENLAYMSLTPSQVERINSIVKESLPETAKMYSIKVTSKGYDIKDLASDAKLKIKGPTESERFVVRVDAPKSPDGLDGRNIALWQSHGWYFEPKLNRWEWQRARIFQTVEDLYTQSYVMPFLMPMLENAGAYVMSPRERDTNLVEIIVDPDGGVAFDGYSEKNGNHGWTDSGVKGFAWRDSVITGNVNPFREGTARKVQVSEKGKAESIATWSAKIPHNDEYAVYVSYVSLPESATDAAYTVHTAAGDRHFKINQKMGGGTWIYLGHFPLQAGMHKVVSLNNSGKDKNTVVTADAVKIGGGMGNIARKVITEKNVADSIDFEPVRSNYPRFTEGARYWLQWAGAPDSVYSPSKGTNDYTDDYRSRGLWVNYLTGGSSMLPQREGLRIPVDLSFAFHSDAGTTRNDSIIGTLSIYCTTSNDSTVFPNGTPRLASRRFTDLVATTIVDDIRVNYEPKWTRRAMWDKSYFEARVPEVPAMLLELLSHQNFADMKYGLDPTFRFTVSRAIYKGMLKFLAERDKRPYVVQPLPVGSFEIGWNGVKKGKSSYSLKWVETADKSEPTATPDYYIVYERINDGAFKEVATVKKPRYDVTVSDSDIHSYRIVAANNGGVSFPSETLSLKAGEGAPDVIIVNGFTRVSGPDTFDAGEIAGFYDMRDHGVPYIKDISFIGSQFEFRREIPWMDDDAAGFGASRANYEDKVIAGNTFDYVYTHGCAIAAAGRSFVSSSLSAYVADKGTSGSNIKILDLILGKQKEIKVGTGAYGTRFKSFTPELQSAIRSHVGRGGSVFVSGSYVATDLWDNPYSSKETADKDKAFAKEVLGYNWRVGQASVTGDAYEVQSRFKSFDGGRFDFYNTLNADSYAVESPDSFFAVNPDKGATIIRYGENNLIAGVACDMGAYKTTVIGFPFEAIKGANSRDILMKQILNFLSK